MQILNLNVVAALSCPFKPGSKNNSMRFHNVVSQFVRSFDRRRRHRRSRPRHVRPYMLATCQIETGLGKEIEFHANFRGSKNRLFNQTLYPSKAPKQLCFCFCDVLDDAFGDDLDDADIA